MKGVRFYEVYDSPKKKRKRESTGNVIAVFTDDESRRYSVMRGGIMDCVSAVFFEPNSACAGDGVACQFLWSNCRRIAEARAREIHPNLFKYLECS